MQIETHNCGGQGRKKVGLEKEGKGGRDEGRKEGREI
jgi:hypothetical protein